MIGLDNLNSESSLGLAETIELYSIREVLSSYSNKIELLTNDSVSKLDELYFSRLEFIFS